MKLLKYILIIFSIITIIIPFLKLQFNIDINSYFLITYYIIFSILIIYYTIKSNKEYKFKKNILIIMPIMFIVSLFIVYCILLKILNK